MAKYSAKINRRAFVNALAPVDGWLLVSREESDHGTGVRKGPWYVSWHELFGTKKEAVAFATETNWPGPWKAVRGSLSATAK